MGEVVEVKKDLSVGLAPPVLVRSESVAIPALKIKSEKKGKKKNLYRFMNLKLGSDIEEDSDILRMKCCWWAYDDSKMVVQLGSLRCSFCDSCYSKYQGKDE